MRRSSSRSTRAKIPFRLTPPSTVTEFGILRLHQNSCGLDAWQRTPLPYSTRVGEGQPEISSLVLGDLYGCCLCHLIAVILETYLLFTQLRHDHEALVLSLQPRALH